MIGVKLIPDEERLVRLLSLREQREALEERLDMIAQQRAINQYFYNRKMAELDRQERQVHNAMRKIIREESKGRLE